MSGGSSGGKGGGGSPGKGGGAPNVGNVGSKPMGKGGGGAPNVGGGGGGIGNVQAGTKGAAGSPNIKPLGGGLGKSSIPPIQSLMQKNRAPNVGQKPMGGGGPLGPNFLKGHNPNSVPGGPPTGFRPKSLGRIKAEMNLFLKQDNVQNLLQNNTYFKKLHDNLPQPLQHKLLETTTLMEPKLRGLKQKGEFSAPEQQFADLQRDRAMQDRGGPESSMPGIPNISGESSITNAPSATEGIATKGPVSDIASIPADPSQIAPLPGIPSPGQNMPPSIRPPAFGGDMGPMQAPPIPQSMNNRLPSSLSPAPNMQGLDLNAPPAPFKNVNINPNSLNTPPAPFKNINPRLDPSGLNAPPAPFNKPDIGRTLQNFPDKFRGPQNIKDLNRMSQDLGVGSINFRGQGLLANTAYAGGVGQMGLQMTKELPQMFEKVKPMLPKGANLNVVKTMTNSQDLFQKYGLDTPQKQAHFMAQMAHETGGFKWLEEAAWLSDSAKRRYFKRYDGREDLGNTTPGDGYKYRGRGLIHLTGKANYQKYGDKIGKDLVNNPELAADPKVATQIALEYWKDKGLNKLAETNNIKEITYRINGGYNGLKERINWFNRFSNIFQ